MRTSRCLSLALLAVCLLAVPALVWAFQGDSTVVVPTPEPSTLTLFGTILLLAVPGVTAVIAKLAYDGLKTILPFYDRLPANVHMIAAPVLSFLFGWVVGHLGLTPVHDVGGVDYAWFNASLTTLATAGIYRWQKAKQPGDATVSVAVSRESGGTLKPGFSDRAPRI